MPPTPVTHALYSPRTLPLLTAIHFQAIKIDLTKIPSVKIIIISNPWSFWVFTFFSKV